MSLRSLRSFGPSESSPDAPAALVFEERQYTLPQLDALANGLATSLSGRGVTAGDPVTKRLSRVVFVAEIPRLPSGKVLRRMLKESYGCTPDR
jgi:acyl-CoA synthetase (AMP-forming)/AMP-acid ligase II